MELDRPTPPRLQRFIGTLEKETRSLAESSRAKSSVLYNPRGIKICITGSTLKLQVLLTPKDRKAPHYAQSRSFLLANIGPSEDLSEPVRQLLPRILDIVLSSENCLDQRTLRTFFSGTPERTMDLIVSPKDMQLPRPVSLKISFQCNTACIFCAEHRTLSTHKDLHIPLPAIYTMIDKARRSKKNVISFDGGEPTLSPHILDAIAYARRNTFNKIGIVTNGIRLSDRRFLDELIDRGLNSINFSLHAADKKTSGLIYGVPVFAAQQKALANINALKTRPQLTIQTVVTRHNERTLSHILKTAARYRPSEIIVICCMIDQKGIPHREELLPNVHSGELMRTVSAFQRGHRDIPVILRGFPFCQIPDHFRKDMQRTGKEPLRFNDDIRPQSSGKKAPNKNTCPSCRYADICPFPLRTYGTVYAGVRKFFVPVPVKK